MQEERTAREFTTGDLVSYSECTGLIPAKPLDEAQNETASALLQVHPAPKEAHPRHARRRGAKNARPPRT